MTVGDKKLGDIVITAIVNPNPALKRYSLLRNCRSLAIGRAYAIKMKP
jgi:hypothetical protein